MGLRPVGMSSKLPVGSAGGREMGVLAVRIGGTVCPVVFEQGNQTLSSFHPSRRSKGSDGLLVYTRRASFRASVRVPSSRSGYPPRPGCWKRDASGRLTVVELRFDLDTIHHRSLATLPRRPS